MKAFINTFWRKTNSWQHNLFIVFGFVLVFKFVATLFYGSYFYFFNTLAPKWNLQMHDRFGVEFWFLQLKPYLNFSFFLSSLKSPTSYLGILIFVYLFFHRKKISWEAFGAKALLKWVFILPGFLLCWELLTYDYNYYLDQYFLLERILMAVSLILIWFHPMYSVWFLMIAFLFRAQFDYPLGGFPLFDKKVLFDAYVVLISFLLIATRKKLSKKWLFYFLMILIAGNYFATGLGKLRFVPHGYEWFQNPLGCLILNGIERGWNVPGFWVEELSKYKIVLQVLIMLLELSAISLLWKRKWAIFLLLGFTLMHFGILYFGGIFFWKWILMDFMAIAFLLLSKTVKNIFKPEFFIPSIIVVPLAVFWSNAYTIGWLDTKYNQIFSYTVVLENGKERNASQSLFNPYHQLFYRGKFLYVIDEKRLKITEFGYTFNFELAEAIDHSAIGSLGGIKTQFGINQFDENLNQKHTEFVKAFFHNYNERIGNNFWPNHLKAPEHIYNYVPPPNYDGQSKVKRLNIYLTETYIEKNEVVILEKKLVKSIKIP